MLLLAEGDLIADEYKIFQTTAGGMGAVFFCKDSKGGTTVLKTYLDNEENIEELRSRFIEEASAWIVINNSTYLLPFEDIIFHGSKPFIKIEYCEKGNLRKYIGDLNEETAITYLIQICLGLKDLIERYSYIHLDMKPENILIAQNGEILICDLGIAKIYKQSLGKKLISTAGSIPYMAPEQMTANPIDFRTDMYALGMIFYEMLTGKQLFEGESIEEIINNKVNRNYSRNFNSLKTEYKEIIATLTHPNINQRPNCYFDILKIIDNFIKLDKVFKKLPFYKKDTRRVISNQRLVGFWMENFPDRIESNNFLISFSFKALADIERARKFHKLEKYLDAIQCCDSTLQSGDGYTVFDAFILKSATAESAFKKIYDDSQSDRSLKNDISLMVGASAYNVLEQLFMSSVGYIEDGGNDQKIISLIKQYADRSLQIKDLPEKLIAVLVQVLVKTKRYTEAHPILIALMNSKSVLVRFKSYATLAVSCYQTKNFDVLVDLINERIIPETEKYNTHLAQRTCGQSLFFINNFELGAKHFYNAYLLDSSDLWSLKQSISCYFNANKTDTAKKLFQIMFEQDANSPHTKQVISMFKEAKLIS